MRPSLSSTILDFFFPPFCAGCKKIGSFLCQRCYDQLQFYTLPIRLSLPSQHFDHLIAAVEYTFPMRELLQQLKYDCVRNIADFLGEFLYNTTYFPLTDLIIPVPLHIQRLHQRGFNQAAEIAKALSRQTNISYLPILQKTLPSMPQAQKNNRLDRLQNLENHFALIPETQQFVRQKSILLIDDVSTTGTTLNECAKVLKAAGSREITCLVVAHGR